MGRPIQEPVTRDSSHRGDETVTEHPAFGQIGASRVSGQAALYDSDFRHQHYMTISIRRSQLHRSLNRDWHFGREEIIQVALTEAQWATFVSSPNMGSGVPCTLQHLHGETIPGLPAPTERIDQFKAEMEEKLAGSIRRIDNMIAGAKTKAHKTELEMLRQELVSNLPFVAKQFGEHVETTVEKGKQEIHGYMTSVLQRAGLEALTGGLPLVIEHDDGERE